MTNDVIFKVIPELSDERRQILLDTVKTLPGVVAAAPVRRGATTGMARQFCFARLKPNANAEELAETLQRFPEVVYAEVPPKRTIADD